MKSKLVLLALCFSMCIVGNAQTRRPAQRITAKKAPATPSANGLFQLLSLKGFFNDTDQKGYVVITAPGKSTSDIKSSIVSTLSSMYTNPSQVVSTLGDNIINVTANAPKACMRDVNIGTNVCSFTYNIKIEIKDGRIRVESPSFSNIKLIFVPYFGNSEPKSISTLELYDEILKSPESQQANVRDLFNLHITNIVNGLSSNSDW